jgi:hypothetical protein
LPHRNGRHHPQRRSDHAARGLKQTVTTAPVGWGSIRNPADWFRITCPPSSPRGAPGDACVAGRPIFQMGPRFRGNDTDMNRSSRIRIET